MIPLHELLIFMLAAFVMVITPGPNMIYCISRSITQGRKAGLISLLGVACGFLFHILLVSFGLTAVLFTVPYAYTVLKSAGVIYLLYLAWEAVKPGSKSVFEARRELPPDGPGKLFTMGLFTNMLNPKVAVFYLSFFPQFIKPEYGNLLAQSLFLGFTQLSISFISNGCIVLMASRVTAWFSHNPRWIRVQKWFMASVLSGLALKLALDKGK
ncbi:LysE family translocator [Chitinophaga agrisoli]|uniref:LysE family translocator n=1 Tax=Chitinophaga agrisoli TaxID=2607653 RepID=A0A5B2W006_9BACT|nr:LysE family translocator [Chitinophaga agrisoli]KAA2243639.1 LysE family translocator [Chitinophaga agrisoli]